MQVFSPAAAISGFDFAALSEARYQHGGDYQDVFLAPGCVGIAVGDVAGHDATAVRLRRMACAMLKQRTVAPGMLGPVMDGMNRDLGPHLQAGRFMTLFLAVMVTQPRSIHWVSAGHGHVIVFDPLRNEFGTVPGGDIPLGVDPDWRYCEQQHQGWPTGALLVVGTDGIWEARNRSGRMYGGRRLMAVIRRSQALTALGIAQAVRDDLVAFRRGAALADDATLLVVKAV